MAIRCSLGFIHVCCLVTSNKIVAARSLHSIHACSAHAVQALRCNYYIHVHNTYMYMYMYCDKCFTLVSVICTCTCTNSGCFVQYKYNAQYVYMHVTKQDEQ